MDVPRLGPPPRASSVAVSRSMKSNRAKDTSPEVMLRKALREVGLRDYKLNPKVVPGRPDIVYPDARLALFIHGCFWHRCPDCDLPLPKTNRGFWRRKFIRNKERDARKKRELKKLGWKVLELWECMIKKDASRLAERIVKKIESH